jgi:hypothetical protein
MLQKITTLKRILFILFSFTSVSHLIAQQCLNVGFEDGTTTNWTCTSGTHGTTGTHKCNLASFPTITNTPGCIDGGTNATNTPSDFSKNRHTIMSQKNLMDPNSNNTVSVVAPGNLFPNGINNYSFRLGNAVGSSTPNNANTLAFAESIKYTIAVNSGNAGLTLLYALFIKEDSIIRHQPLGAPHFTVKITNQKNEIIDCGLTEMTTFTSNMRYGAKDGNGQWRYSNWQKLGLDLTGYIGMTLTIELTTADCMPLAPNVVNGDTVCFSAPGNHSTYAYIDMYCAPLQIQRPVICSNQQAIELCAPEGFATYNWPGNQPGIKPPFNQRCVSVVLPKAGDSYKVNLTSSMGGCPSQVTVTLLGNDFKVNDTSICKSAGAVQLTVVPSQSGSYQFKWEPATYLNNSKIQNPIFTPGATTTYTVTMIDMQVQQCNQVKKITVTVDALVTSNSDITINAGETAALNAILKPGVKGNWIGGAGTFTPDRSTPNAIYTPTAAEETAGIVQLIMKATDSSNTCKNENDTMIVKILSTVGITMVDKNSISMEVYPNPFHTELSITVFGDYSPAAELKMYDHLGREVKSQPLKNGSQKITRNNLPAGSYLLEVVDQGKILGKKKIIIHE